MQRMCQKLELALWCAALCGFAGRERSACAGLKYSEAGLERGEFAPCAAAMVRQLDRAEQAVEVMADRSRPESERIRARQACLAASAGLGGLLRQAGGSQKLTASWADSRLNEFSRAVLSSKDWYTMACY